MLTVSREGAFAWKLVPKSRYSNKLFEESNIYTAKGEVGLVEMGVMTFLTEKTEIVLAGSGPNCCSWTPADEL